MMRPDSPSWHGGGHGLGGGGDESLLRDVLTRTHANAYANTPDAAMLQVVQRELDEVKLEKIEMASEIRMRDQDIREMMAEVNRLNNLVTSIQAQHKDRLTKFVEEKEQLSKKLSTAEDSGRYHEKECAAAREELALSLAERETLSNTVEQLLREKEEAIVGMHQAQDTADHWELKWEQLTADQAHNEEELAALRSNSEFNEQYIKTIKTSHERLQDEACRLQAELQGLLLERSAPKTNTSTTTLARTPSVPPQHQRQPQPQPQLYPPAAHNESIVHGSADDSTGVGGYYHDAGGVEREPYQQDPYHHHHHHHQPMEPYVEGVPHVGYGGYGRDDDDDEEVAMTEPGGGGVPPWAGLDDPMSPYRHPHPRGQGGDGDGDRGHPPREVHHHYYHGGAHGGRGGGDAGGAAGFSPHGTPPPPQPQGEGRGRDASASPVFDAEMDRMRARLEKLHAEVHVARVEDSYVQKEYIIEASERLGGALAALETLTALAQDWRGSITCGRDPWGDHPCEEETLAKRRQREMQKRLTLKKEMSRTLRHSGLGDDVASILELFFASGRVRETVTLACESFQAAKEAADTSMLAAKRTIQESLDSAKMQQDSMKAAKTDADHMDDRLRELTKAKFEAEGQIESLKRQVEERDAYQNEVARMSTKMKEEAQEERVKISEIALKMTDKHNEEVQRLAAKQKDELEALTKHHVQRVEALQKANVDKVAEMAAELQAARDEIAALEKSIDEKNNLLAVANAKKKSHKAAKESLLSEMMDMKRATAGLAQENKELKQTAKRFEKENMVLKELSSKLESDVRRGRILIEGESERHAFAAWRRNMLGGGSGPGSLAGGEAPTLPAASERSASAATQPPAVQRRSTSSARRGHPFVMTDEARPTRDCAHHPGTAYMTGSPLPPHRGAHHGGPPNGYHP